jgi:glycogen debranching enzyme
MTSTLKRTNSRRAAHGARFVQPLVLKQGSVFLLCSEDGDIAAGSDQGVYFHDMRHLSGASVRLDGAPLVSLLADAGDGHRALFQLTNPELQDTAGTSPLPKETLGIRREKLLGDTYVETFTVENYAAEAVDCTLQLSYAADFADMFVVRGMLPGKRGKLRTPAWRGSTLTFSYAGADRHQRRTVLRFSQPPDHRDAGELTFNIHLVPKRAWVLTVTCELSDRASGQLEARPQGSEGANETDRQRARSGALGGGAHVESSNPLFNAILARSFMDLHMLRMRQQDQVFFAAGVPWYVALFGRDSLITALEVLAFEPEIAANTLRVLASHQATRIDDERDAQPGKILHELRVDEMANLNEVPQTPYYGSVDSTPLFLVLLGRHAGWTGSLDLFHELRENVRAALEWIDRFGDADGDGFVDYQTRSSKGGRNQGWKDSGNGIVMQNGRLAEPPIAMPEVQGNVYLAWRCMAELYERDGDAVTAQHLRERARDLYTRFNREFWLPREGYFAFCRQKDGRFSTSIASNPAHALWTGIVDPRRAADVAERVMRPDMFSGWGIRTLSSEDRSYNPVDYQVGSIWPHDNAMIAAGLQRYGFAEQAAQVFTAIVDAAAQFEHYRLPEVFAGYERRLASKPVKYPVACNPQAWAAGAMPYMLAAMLGIDPDAFNGHLQIARPCLPVWLEWMVVEDLRVGQARVNLRYEHSGHNTVVAVTRKWGNLEVDVRY